MSISKVCILHINIHINDEVPDLLECHLKSQDNALIWSTHLVFCDTMCINSFMHVNIGEPQGKWDGSRAPRTNKIEIRERH